VANNLGPIACWAEQVIVTYFEQPLLAASYFMHLLFLHYVLPTYVWFPVMSTNKLHYVMPTYVCLPFAYSEALVSFLAYDDK